MRVAVTGATGTIGRALVAELVGRGDSVTALSRNAERARAVLGEVQTATWERPKERLPPADALRGHDAVVNLLGETLGRRWSDEAKREIRDSRVLPTRNLVAALGELAEDERPRVLVSGSGVDWYEGRGDERLDERAAPGHGFAADVVHAWEDEARAAERHGVRVVTTRTGIVLARGSAALEKMLPFFKLGIGGPVAGGRQYMSWIHLDDAVGAIVACLDAEEVTGPVNLTAPEPATNRDFSRALGRALQRPAVIPVPALALKVLYGEMSIIVTSGRRVVPGRLSELGYTFRRQELEAALREATTSRRPSAHSTR